MDQNKLPPGLTEFLKDFPRVEIVEHEHETFIYALSSSDPTLRQWGKSSDSSRFDSDRPGNISGNKSS